ncbi:FecR domain-containing protein [Butyricimonas paravirosa]
MNQEERDIRLLEYWQGESLSLEEVREVEGWLGEKVENRRYFEDLQREFLRQRWAMRERLVSRKGERRFRQVARKRAMFRRAVAIAACVSALFLAGGGYYWWTGGVRDVQLVENGVIHHGSSKARLFLSTGDVVELGKERKSLREQQTVAIDVEQEGMVAYRDAVIAEETGDVVYNKLEVNRGGEYRIVLADGSEVWVNSESELVYPVRFAGEKRVVRLKGEAYFKVQADADHPFVVEVNGVEVAAVGTEFNVNSRKEKVVESVLVKGQVEVVNGTRQVMLTPNQLAVCDVETNGIVVKEVDVRKYIDWKNGDFVFSDDRLEDVMNKLALWYDCDVVYADTELKEIRLSGDMKRYGEVEEFLHFLEISTGAHFSVKNKTIVVSIK